MADDENQRPRYDDAADYENPATQRVAPFKASPGAIAEAMEEPEIFEQIARGDLYMELVRLRQLAASHAMPISGRLEYAKFLARMGAVQQPDAGENVGDKLPVIQIVLPNSGKSTRVGTTLDGDFEEI